MCIRHFKKFDEYYRANSFLNLEEFIVAHGGDHEVIYMKKTGPKWPENIDEIRQRFGSEAQVEFLGERSPYYGDFQALYFVIRSGDQPGGKQFEEVHVVVFAF